MEVGKGREQERKLCPGMGGMSQGAKDGGVTSMGWAKSYRGKPMPQEDKRQRWRYYYAFQRRIIRNIPMRNRGIKSAPTKCVIS
jgi:hypothetical protein